MFRGIVSEPSISPAMVSIHSRWRIVAESIWWHWKDCSRKPPSHEGLGLDFSRFDNPQTDAILGASTNPGDRKDASDSIRLQWQDSIRCDRKAVCEQGERDLCSGQDGRRWTQNIPYG